MTILVVGAGAAGLMAATITATIARENDSNAQVILVEKNKILGHKVIISGGGRCNVTTGIRDVRELLKRYPRGSKFLTSAMYAFPPDHVYQWFEDHGVPLKIEADMRVFPQSNNGHDIVDVFDIVFKTVGVEVILRDAVSGVSRMDQQFEVTFKSGRILLVDRLILTTGGQSYRHTGSTGDGYAFAEALGHTITELSTSLNSFILHEAWPKERSGVSFSHVQLTVATQPKIIARGPMVCTHQGISGPAVFALAAQVAFEQYTKATPLAMTIDFVPDSSQEKIQAQLTREIDDVPKQLLKTTIHHWLPHSMVETMFQELNIPMHQINAETSNTIRRQIIDWLKACPVQAIGRGSGAEFVTAGGVDTAEVNPKTMESLLCPGLFFAGEILNIDGLTGGYNLQAAWATGYVAGSHL